MTLEECIRFYFERLEVLVNKIISCNEALLEKKYIERIGQAYEPVDWNSMDSIF